jgi:hypothetical protein
MVRTYSFPGFYEATGNLGLQPFARIDQVEAKVVPVLCRNEWYPDETTFTEVMDDERDV